MDTMDLAMEILQDHGLVGFPWQDPSAYWLKCCQNTTSQHGVGLLTLGTPTNVRKERERVDQVLVQLICCRSGFSQVPQNLWTSTTNHHSTCISLINCTDQRLNITTDLYQDFCHYNLDLFRPQSPFVMCAVAETGIVSGALIQQEQYMSPDFEVMYWQTRSSESAPGRGTASGLRRNEDVPAVDHLPPGVTRSAMSRVYQRQEALLLAEDRPFWRTFWRTFATAGGSG